MDRGGGHAHAALRIQQRVLKRINPLKSGVRGVVKRTIRIEIERAETDVFFQFNGHVKVGQIVDDHIAKQGLVSRTGELVFNGHQIRPIRCVRTFHPDTNFRVVNAPFPVAHFVSEHIFAHETIFGDVVEVAIRIQRQIAMLRTGLQ